MGLSQQSADKRERQMGGGVIERREEEDELLFASMIWTETSRRARSLQLMIERVCVLVTTPTSLLLEADVS